MMEEASDELLLFSEVCRASERSAADDELVVTVPAKLVTLAANDALFPLVEDSMVVILNAAELLFVVTVEVRLVTDEFSDADAA